MRSPRFGRIATALALALALFGCSRPVGSVSGTVTYNGKPLKGGSVIFISLDGNPGHSADISETGAYSLSKVTAGQYKVCVDTSYLAPQNQNMAAMMPYGKGAKTGTPLNPIIPKGAKSAPPPDANIPEGYTPSDPAAMQTAQKAKNYVKIPEKYKDPETTDLRFEGKGGDESYPIELK